MNDNAASRPGTDGPGPRPAPAVVAAGISKYYPGVVALEDVSLEIPPGQIHGLVGENGAGKSTLMKVVAGAIRPEAGTVSIGGIAVEPGDPRATADAGLAMIYQELTVVPGLSAAANLRLGSWPNRAGVLDRKAMRQDFRQLATEFGVDVAPETLAGRLSVAQQQRLEIMRAVAGRRHVVVMDEPTASLGPADRKHLHQVVLRLKERGTAVVYISHDLDEVLHLCDTVSVMREGRLIQTAAAAQWDTGTLVAAMLGRSHSTSGVARSAKSGGEVMHVRRLRSGALQVDELSVRRGEILGIAGLVGSGRTELLRALAGADRVQVGIMEVDGAVVRWPRSVRAALRLGVALAPEDRKGEGLVLGQPASSNVMLPRLRRARRHLNVTAASLMSAADPPARKVGFDADRLHQPAGTFSGGNQQKVLLARWVGAHPRVLLLDEPTRGIDIGAKAEVFATMRALADDGLAVVFVSSETEEVVRNADRVLVMSRGRIVADLGTAPDLDDVLRAAFGQSTVAAAPGGPASERASA